MSVFGVFKSKKESGAPPQWAKKLQGFRTKSEGEQWALCDHLFKDVSKAYSKSKVLRVLEEDLIELTARVGELPFTLTFYADGARLGVVLRCPNRLGLMRWVRDHSHADAHGEASEAPEPTAHRLRVFIARGIFTEGSASQVNEALRTFVQLPEDMQQELPLLMEQWRLSFLDAGVEEVSLGLEPPLDELPEPLGHCHSAIQILAALAQVLAAGQRDLAREAAAGSSVPPGAMIARLGCAHCGAQFLPTPSGRCPSCAAAYVR